MYIIGLQFSEESLYYIRVNENGWDEVYDPSFATQFKSKSGPRIWGKANTTFGEYVKSLKADEEIEKYKKWASEGTVRRSFNLVDKNMSRKYNNENPLEILNWWYKAKTSDEDLIRYEDYKTWPQLYEVFEHIWECRQVYSNITHLSLELCFEISSKQDASYEKFKEEFELISHLHTFEEDGYKSFPIHDHYLCEGGNKVSLLYKTDTDCKVVGRWQESIRGSLKDCFDYIKKERYRESY